MTTYKRISAAIALVLATWVLLPTAGNAQLPIDLPTVEPSPSPEPSPTPTKTSSPTPDPDDDSGRGGSGGGAAGGDGGRSGGTSGGTNEKRSDETADGEASAVVTRWLNRDRTPARTTTRLLNLLERANRYERPSGARLAAGFGRFPVVGYVWYQDDYGAPRYNGLYYTGHAGTDIFAVRGTPVGAVADGYIWRMATGSIGGNQVWLMGDDGIRYFYGHFHRFAHGLREGQRVSVGDRIGYVGNTGNAKGTYPHVHFEVNPGGLGTINPKPILDAWLDAAELNALEAVRSLTGTDMPGPAGWDALLLYLAEPPAERPAVWMSALDASATLAMADLALDRLLVQGGLLPPAHAPAPASSFHALNSLRELSFHASD